MKFPQQIRQGWLTILKYTLNPLTRTLARTSFGPVSIIRHVGRRSGKRYETPIIAQPADDGFVFVLTYGPNVDWYQNVIAAGSATLVWHGREYVLDRIKPMDAESGRHTFPLLARILLRATRRQHYVKMMIANTPDNNSHRRQHHGNAEPN